MSDYFERLLLRHTPAAPLTPSAPDGPDVRSAPRPAARVRPRLPGPFERVEALRGGRQEQDGPAPLLPPEPASEPGRQDESGLVRSVREIRTERQTVVRGEPAPGVESRPPGPRAQGAGKAVLRPVPGPLRPAGQTADRDGGGRPRRTTGRDVPEVPVLSAVSVPATRGTDTATPSRAPAARPDSGDLAAARGAQRVAAGRRGGQKPAERVVHVQIGRLEVSASAPGPGRGGAGVRGERAERSRSAPTVSLEDYLARGQNGERSN